MFLCNHIEKFMDNDSITKFLQNNTSRDYTERNKNTNGVIGMKSYFGEETGKPRAIQFNKALENIKKLKTGIDSGKDYKLKGGKKMKNKINELVKQLNAEPKEEHKIREHKGRRMLGMRQLRTEDQDNHAENEEVKSDILSQDVRSPKIGSKKPSASAKADPQSRNEFELYPFLKDKMIEFENYPLLREQDKLKKRSKYLKYQAKFIDHLTSKMTPIHEMRRLIMVPIPV